MAVTAKFGVDFTAFTTAVDKMQAQLRLFEGDAGKAQLALNKMADGFSGVKIFQQATLAQKAVADLGGVTQLTAKEQATLNRTLTEALEKYRVLGQQAPAGMQDLANATKTVGTATQGWGSQLNSLMATLGVGVSVGGVVAFGRELLRMGDELVKVADRTGLTTVEVQKLQFIAGQSGNTLDELTGAISKLQRGLTLGDSGAVAAVKQLGLSLEALKNESPFQQMNDVATAIAKVEDPAQRATLAMQLFGKGGAEILPTLIANFQALGDAAPVMSDKTVRALDAAGDAFAKFSLTVKVAAAETYNFAGRMFDRLTAFALSTAASIVGAITTFLEIEQHIPGVTTVFNKLGISTKGLRETQQQLNDTGKLLVSHLGDQEVAIRKTTGAVAEFEPKVTKATSAVREHKIEIIGLGSAEKLLEDVTNRQAAATAHYYERLEQIIPATREWWGLIAQTEGEISVLASHSLPAATGAVADLGSGVEHLGGQLQRTGEQAHGFGEALTETLRDFPKMLTDAFTGGGGLEGAFKALGVKLGMKLGKGLSESMNDAISFGTAGAAAIGAAAGGTTGATIAALAGPIGGATLAMTGLVTTTVALGAATMGIGAAAVGVYLLAKHYLKVSDAEKEARKQFDAYAKAIGVSNVDEFIAKVGAAYAKMGKDGNEAQRDLQRALDATHKSAADTAAALKVIDDKMRIGAAAMDGLNDALSRYKFTTAELGPVFAKQKLDEQAKQLYQDWQLLAAAGIDVAAIGREMAESINAFLHDAVATGLEVDAALKPMLEKMASMGLLTDAAGNQITDLNESGVKFSLTMSEGFKLVVDAVNEMTKAIKQALHIQQDLTGEIEKAGDAAKDIPDNPYKDWNVPDLPESSLQSFAAGGIVRPFPGGRNSGLVQAHVGELVLTPAQQRAAFRGGRGGGGSSGTIQTHVYLNGREIATAVTDQQESDYRLKRKVRAA